ncbi:MAG: M23 family metallopeptidase [Parabacteroides sp.]
MRKFIYYTVISLLFFLCSPARAQFITIMGETEEVKQDTLSIEYTKGQQPFGAFEFDEHDFEDEELEDEEDGEKKQSPFKKLAGKIKKLFSHPKAERDTVPTDPDLFSYDEIENEGQFIFTEADEKAYLDSIKYELIKRRRAVLQKRSMVSMPMERLQITSYFGYRKDPFTKQVKFHNGVDFAARNYFVNAVLPGIVHFAGYRGGYGYCVELQHGNIHTLYAHLSYILVQKNQPVPAGEPIGISGTTGRSTGEHLHFSVINKGKFVDPMSLLDYLGRIQSGDDETTTEYPSYDQLTGRRTPTQQPEPEQTPIDTIPTDTLPTAAPKRTSGMMIVSEESQNEVVGVIRQGGQTQGEENGNPIIHYSGQRSDNTSGNGIIHHSGQTDTQSNPEELPEGSTIVNGQVLPPMKNSIKRGMIIAEGTDSITPIRPLTRQTQTKKE